MSTGRYWVKVFFPPSRRRHRRPSRSPARSRPPACPSARPLASSLARSPSGVLGDEFHPVAIAYRGHCNGGEVGPTTRGGTLRRATHWRHFVCRCGTRSTLLHETQPPSPGALSSRRSRRSRRRLVTPCLEFPSTLGHFHRYRHCHPHIIPSHRRPLDSSSN